MHGLLFVDATQLASSLRSLGDTDSHRIEQAVYLECREGYRTEGPAHLRAVGETEWVDRIAALARRRPQATQIVSNADLRLGERVREVLEAHGAASQLFRGIRCIAAWDPSNALFSMEGLRDDNLYGDSTFREGFGVLAKMNLVFDAYHYHPQTPHLTSLARAFPPVVIVLDHLGTPVGVGPYAGRQQDIYAQWAHDIAELATCPNVSIKLGGLALPWTGFGFDTGQRPPTSDEMVARQAHYYHHAIETFGPDRCMFESDFPVEKCAVSNATLWNAFKKIASRYTDAEQDAMFRGTASRVYRLQSLQAERRRMEA